jgi:hypothetical protein
MIRCRIRQDNSGPISGHIVKLRIRIVNTDYGRKEVLPWGVAEPAAKVRGNSPHWAGQAGEAGTVASASSKNPLVQDWKLFSFYVDFPLVTPHGPGKRNACCRQSVKNAIKKSHNSSNQGFSYYFCLMIEGSGAGSVPLTNWYGYSTLDGYDRNRIKNKNN